MKEDLSTKEQGAQRVMIIGAGNFGCKVAERLSEQKKARFTILACDTDQSDLESTEVPNRLLLEAEPKSVVSQIIKKSVDYLSSDLADITGEPFSTAFSVEPIRNLLTADIDVVIIVAGMGGKCGTEAVEKRIDDVRELANAKDVAVVVGLGGEFGTEAAPVIAREAKAAGASTVGVATLPFEHEGSVRVRRALDGLRELAVNCDAMFILNNESMLKYYGKLLVLDALVRIDNIMSDAADVLTTHCMRNEPQYKKLNAKVFGIGRAGADLVDYLREKKYRKTLLMTARVNDDSGCIKSVECNIDTGDVPTILDVFSRFFSGKDSRACLVADLGVSGIDTATTMADLAKKNGAITIGLATLPAVSEGAAICTKAIDNLQKLAVKTDAVFAFRKDVCGESVSPFLGLMIEDIEYVVNRLIKEGKNQ